MYFNSTFWIRSQRSQPHLLVTQSCSLKNAKQIQNAQLGEVVKAVSWRSSLHYQENLTEHPQMTNYTERCEIKLITHSKNEWRLGRQETLHHWILRSQMLRQHQSLNHCPRNHHSSPNLQSSIFICHVQCRRTDVFRETKNHLLILFQVGPVWFARHLWYCWWPSRILGLSVCYLLVNHSL